jgi:hypothetical protein
MAAVVEVTLVRLLFVAPFSQSRRHRLFFREWFLFAQLGPHQPPLATLAIKRLSGQTTTEPTIATDHSDFFT